MNGPKKTELERALSKLGFASRTEARALILAGKVSVNGKKQTRADFMVVLERDKIQVEGASVERAARVVLLLNKPRGTVTTRSDEKGRKTVFDLIKKPSIRGLHAVGRLDLATTGLLLLTNDTAFSAWLTDPKSEIRRVYVVSVRGEVTPEKARLLEEGISDGGEKLRAEAIQIRKTSRKESHLVVTLTEGRNREIRRLFKSIGHEVTRLKRVEYGDLKLDEKLEPGAYRELSESELRALFPDFIKK